MPREAEGFVLEPGRSGAFSIAGIGLSLECEEGADPLVLPEAYRHFQSSRAANDVQVRVGSSEALDAIEDRIIYRAAHHWRARADGDALSFEIFYPPTSEVYCRMRGGPGLSRLELEFGRRNLERLPKAFTRECEGHLWVPHPFEQLALIPALAQRGGYLVHACGAVVGGRALVFAGHSGDGKTTLSRLLSDEGIELLSDERVAIRRDPSHGFVVHGTPWAGEGEVVSNACVPLAGVFVLRKASAHRVAGGNPGELAAELLARSLVPYYLGEETHRILSLVQETASAVPLGELEFELAPGLGPLLQAFVEKPGDRDLSLDKRVLRSVNSSP